MKELISVRTDLPTLSGRDKSFNGESACEGTDLCEPGHGVRCEIHILCHTYLGHIANYPTKRGGDSIFQTKKSCKDKEEYSLKTSDAQHFACAHFKGGKLK